MNRFKFECNHGSRKDGQRYNICRSGFDIMYNRQGIPTFKCKDCGTVYDISSLDKRAKEYGLKKKKINKNEEKNCKNCDYPCFKSGDDLLVFPVDVSCDKFIKAKVNFIRCDDYIEKYKKEVL